MKKTILPALFLAACLTGSLRAMEPVTITAMSKSPRPYIATDWKWTPFQMTLWTRDFLSLFSTRIEVRGLNVSFTTTNPTTGLAVALLNESAGTVGVNISGEAVAAKNAGLSVSLFAFIKKNYACSIALFNRTTDNHGLLAAVFNKSSGDNSGVQAGVFNDGPQDNGTCFLQIGALNFANRGWQFGLLNYNRNSCIPYTLLFNYSAAGPMPIH